MNFVNVLYKLKSAAGARGVSVDGALSLPFVRIGIYPAHSSANCATAGYKYTGAGRTTPRQSKKYLQNLLKMLDIGLTI